MGSLLSSETLMAYRPLTGGSVWRVVKFEGKEGGEKEEKNW